MRPSGASMPASPRSHLFVKHLTVLDNAILHAEHGLVGESWIVDLELEGPLDQAGMVMDFGEVKKHIKQRLDAEADHRLLVPMQAEWLKLTDQNLQPMLHATLKDGSILQHKSPMQALCLLAAPEVTLEAMSIHASTIVTALLMEMGLSLHAARISLRSERIEGAYYHYCHGLKKHDGNCQRIAHGHRSQVQVWIDDKRDTKEEALLSESWNRRYLGSAEDAKHRSSLHGVDYHHFSHISGQGSFELVLPVSRCDLLRHDTTVEWLANTLAQRVKERHPNKKIRVQAFEGVDKGAWGHA